MNNNNIKWYLILSEFNLLFHCQVWFKVNTKLFVLEYQTKNLKQKCCEAQMNCKILTNNSKRQLQDVLFRILGVSIILWQSKFLMSWSKFLFRFICFADQTKLFVLVCTINRFIWIKQNTVKLPCPARPNLAFWLASKY